MKFRPGQNTIEDYTTIQFGVADWLSFGTDLYKDKIKQIMVYMLASVRPGING